MRKYTGSVDRFFLFCKVQQSSAGNALASAWDFDTGGGKTFETVILSGNGQLPATHYGANTVVDSAMKNGISNAITQGTPWLTGYKESDGYTFKTACEDINLKGIEELT